MPPSHPRFGPAFAVFVLLVLYWLLQALGWLVGQVSVWLFGV